LLRLRTSTRTQHPAAAGHWHVRPRRCPIAKLAKPVTAPAIQLAVRCHTARMVLADTDVAERVSTRNRNRFRAQIHRAAVAKHAAIEPPAVPCTARGNRAATSAW